MEEQIKFYEKLLQSEGWNKDEANKLMKNIDITLTEEQKEMCDKEICEDEATKAVKSLKIEKSPGFDGIPNEFYKKYWPLLKKNFMQVIKEIEETEELCISQYRGVLCLIYKSGDRDEIPNWRPITLLNTDYKIIAIIYAERLKEVLPFIIKKKKKAYIEGRNIMDSIRQTQAKHYIFL